MKRRVLAVLMALTLVVSTAGAVLADGNNPANNGGATTGYEGQPGNQSNN